MSPPPLILALDQGTTSSRAMVFDLEGAVIATAQREFAQIFPRPGWVEHDPEAIWTSQLEVARSALDQAEALGGRVVALGLTNQRETAVVWERASGRAIHNAIVWQDRRTDAVCRRLDAEGAGAAVQASTGLRLDPYFSATKFAWMLDHVDGARARAERGELAFGTIDAFLIHRLTGGRAHRTDATNASRTSLYDIAAGDWDDALLALFDVPRPGLPRVQDCASDFGPTDPAIFGRPIPILGVAGDQQAALVGQGCFAPGEAKCTFGTGAFLLVNTGGTPRASAHRLLTTVGYRLDDVATYALEGSVFVAGAAVQWLRDGLGLIGAAAETETLARSVESSDGVYLIPAFTGLGAPHWDAQARGAIHGLTRATTRAHLARATLEAVALQTHDLVDAMIADGAALATLRVDGGMVANDWFCQTLADIVDVAVERPACGESSALGAAWLAARQAGLIDPAAPFASTAAVRRFEPSADPTIRRELIDGWKDAVARVRSTPE